MITPGLDDCFFFQFGAILPSHFLCRIILKGDVFNDGKRKVGMTNKRSKEAAKKLRKTLLADRRPARPFSLFLPSHRKAATASASPISPGGASRAATNHSGPAGGCDRCRVLAQLPRGAEAATRVSERARPPTRKSGNARAGRSKRNGTSVFQRTKKNQQFS